MKKSIYEASRLSSHLIRRSGLALVFALGLGLWVALAIFMPLAQAQAVLSPAAAVGNAPLLEKYAALASGLANSPFGRPLVIESVEDDSRITGHAYAVLDAPFESVSSVFQSPERLCDLIVLHLNTKYCRPAAGNSGAVLKVNFGKKTPQELGDTFALDFVMHISEATSGALQVLLDAKDGPLGTSNYRIALEAAPLPAGKTFLHLRYSYGFGVAGKIAMQAYLATAGSKKVGFTRVAPTRSAAYIGGMRGAIERNTMRYYLAIDAYLASLKVLPAQQMNARLNHWFDATEKYPEQLGEVDKRSYMTMKKAEYARQQGDARP